MDFISASARFHPTFPLASLFYPPKLPLSSSLPPFIPLSPPSTLFSSPSLLPYLPSSTPPSLHFYYLHSYLRPELPCPVYNTAALNPSRPSPPTNLLVSLPSHLPNTLHLFFPTGDNSHAIAFLSITSQSQSDSGSDSPNPFQVTLNRTGDVFKQTLGFKHPLHRISSLSVSPSSIKSVLGNSVFEGFLLATTPYSVNWFRVETGSFQLDGEEKQRPFLVPLANHGFEKPVVQACFSPHMNEECAVLLQDGELYLFNLCSKKSGRIVVRCRLNLGRFISCEYGAEPWTIIVACANVIVLVDLRNPVEEHTRILFQAKKLGSDHVYHMENKEVKHMEDKKEKFLFFCKSSYSNYHLSVLTKYQLMLLDVRRPLHPILTWEHGLDDPNYVTMLKLEALHPSILHKPVSGLGFSILAGSLSTGEFKLFHYGSIHKQEASCDPSLVAWGVPSGIFLSSQCTGTCNQLMDEHFSRKNTFVKDTSWLKKHEKVVGFLVIPWNKSLIKSNSNGFTFIRLMSFGRLEVQNCGSSDDTPDNKMCMNEEGMSVSCNILTVCPDCKSEEVPIRRYVFDLKYLYAYIHDDLSKILPMDNRQSWEAPLSEDLLALMRDSMNYTPSLSPFIDNATVPSSIVEIAYKSALNGLKPDLIPLAFAKHSDVFPNIRSSNFQLLEVSSTSTSGEERPLIVTKPYRRGQRWSKKSKAPRDKLVGPVLPVPVLLTLQEREKNGNCVFQGDGTIVNQKCTEVFDSIFTANLSADTEETSETKPFFVSEPQCDIIRSKKRKRGHKMECKDGNYETIVCGNNTRLSCDQVKPEPDVAGPELFNVGPVRIDFDLINMEVGKVENEEVQKCKGQLSEWMDKFNLCQHFCTSSNKKFQI